ncbi:Hypothetical predicted protein [Pelobates cultripes]|uniref:Uncharacterized protein n=1 Tax=Pelobates cultripes TaxID=61616 RepID=A0AAD1R3W5_PELCU|nr:Hypothetical predicted protein [Pelobates cultripes]
MGESSQTADDLATKDFNLWSRSTFNPAHSPEVELFSKLIHQEIKILCSSAHDHHCPPNLKKEKREALYALKNNHSLIIKLADKGGAVVVMNRTDYIKEVERQLSDREIYEGDPLSPRCGGSDMEDSHRFHHSVTLQYHRFSPHLDFQCN